VSLILVLSVPLMVVEETWNSHPLIEAHGAGWVAFAIVVPAAFVAGGFVAGRTRRRKLAAIGAGILDGLVAVAVLILSDIFRRLFIVGSGMPISVVGLWAVAGAGAIALAGIGAAAGAANRGRRCAQEVQMPLSVSRGRSDRESAVTDSAETISSDEH
jgi:hypothetical protein